MSVAKECETSFEREGEGMKKILNTRRLDLYKHERGIAFLYKDANSTGEEENKMILKTLADYEREIARVKAAIESTDSSFLIADYGKYLKRLKREAIAKIKEI
jgi:hypothetical protein